MPWTLRSSRFAASAFVRPDEIISSTSSSRGVSTSMLPGSRCVASPLCDVVDHDPIVRAPLASCPHPLEQFDPRRPSRSVRPARAGHRSAPGTGLRRGRRLRPIATLISETPPEPARGSMRRRRRRPRRRGLRGVRPAGTPAATSAERATSRNTAISTAAWVTPLSAATNLQGDVAECAGRDVRAHRLDQDRRDRVAGRDADHAPLDADRERGEACDEPERREPEKPVRPADAPAAPRRRASGGTG